MSFQDDIEEVRYRQNFAMHPTQERFDLPLSSAPPSQTRFHDHSNRYSETYPRPSPAPLTAPILHHADEHHRHFQFGSLSDSPYGSRIHATHFGPSSLPDAHSIGEYHEGTQSPSPTSGYNDRFQQRQGCDHFTHLPVALNAPGSRSLSYEQVSPYRQVETRGRYLDSSGPRQMHLYSQPSESRQQSASPILCTATEPSAASPVIALPAFTHEDSQIPSSGTPFISKLVHLLANPQFHDFIRWNAAGDSFILSHTNQYFASHVLPTYFRHSNTSSFVRQLNMYGFTRLPIMQLLDVLDGGQYGLTGTTAPSSCFSGFSHRFFKRDEPELSVHIKPKYSKREAVTKPKAGTKPTGKSGVKARKTPKQSHHLLPISQSSAATPRSLIEPAEEATPKGSDYQESGHLLSALIPVAEAHAN